MYDIPDFLRIPAEMQNHFANGGMIKRADGSYSRRGLWDNIRANKGSGKKPTKQMLEQEARIKAKEYVVGGPITFSAGGEKHKVYEKESPTGNGKGVEGHIMVTHPTMDKGKWDTIDLTEKAGAHTVTQGVNATKQWHEENPEYGGGGYTVRRSSVRKGKTHVVIGPDGTKKYFGDAKLGQHPHDPARKKAFYARHKHNLANNPYFRAFARSTWEDGGEVPPYAYGGFYGRNDAAKMQRMFTPTANSMSPKFQTGGKYIVKEGDNLWDVSQKQNIDINKIIKLNPQISDPNKIYPGQEINLDIVVPSSKPSSKAVYKKSIAVANTPSYGGMPALYNNASDATRVAIQNPIVANDEKAIAAVMNKYGISRDAAISTINLSKQAAIKANTENKIDYNYTDPRSSNYTGSSLIINPNQLKGKGARILEVGNYGPMDVAAGVAAAAPLVAPTAAAMNTSLAGVPGLTLNNLIGAGFAGHGLKSVYTGEVAEPWKKASKTGNPWDYADAASENIMTGLELLPFVGPAYKGALGAGKAIPSLATIKPYGKAITSLDRKALSKAAKADIEAFFIKNPKLRKIAENQLNPLYDLKKDIKDIIKTPSNIFTPNLLNLTLAELKELQAALPELLTPEVSESLEKIKQIARASIDADKGVSYGPNDIIPENHKGMATKLEGLRTVVNNMHLFDDNTIFNLTASNKTDLLKKLNRLERKYNLPKTVVPTETDPTKIIDLNNIFSEKEIIANNSAAIAPEDKFSNYATGRFYNEQTTPSAIYNPRNPETHPNRVFRQGYQKFESLPSGKRAITATSFSTDSKPMDFKSITRLVDQGKVKSVRFEGMNVLNDLGHVEQSGINPIYTLNSINQEIAKLNLRLPASRQIPNAKFGYAKVSNKKDPVLKIFAPNISVVKMKDGGFINSYALGTDDVEVDNTKQQTDLTPLPTIMGNEKYAGRQSNNKQKPAAYFNPNAMTTDNDEVYDPGTPGINTPEMQGNAIDLPQSSTINPWAVNTFGATSPVAEKTPSAQSAGFGNQNQVQLNPNQNTLSSTRPKYEEDGLDEPSMNEENKATEQEAWQPSTGRSGISGMNRFGNNNNWTEENDGSTEGEETDWQRARKELMGDQNVFGFNNTRNTIRKVGNIVDNTLTAGLYGADLLSRALPRSFENAPLNFNKKIANDSTNTMNIVGNRKGIEYSAYGGVTGYKEGEELDLTAQQIYALEKQGYKFQTL